LKNRLKILLYVLAISIFTFALLPAILNGTPASPAVGNWYQQFMPSIGNRNITDVFFLDSLTGWAVTNATNIGNDTTFVLKTTNSGDTWVIQFRKLQTGGGFPGYFRIIFLNSQTGYTCGVNGVDKTIDGGNSWTSINAPLNSYVDMQITGIDSIYTVSTNSLTGGIFRTTNGGLNWEQQLNLGSQNPGKIYMYNGRIGFASTGAGLYKTTNSGSNWNNISGNGTFFDMYFKDSLNGWKSRQLMDRTTDGGITWITQTLPTGGNIILNYLLKFAYVKTDTIFGVGGLAIVPNGARGFIYRSINGGNTWEYQIPDTAIHAPQYQYIKNINNNLWAYWFLSGIHTTNGGDPIWLTGIEQISTEIPKKYKLYQNYPNPFNPYTNIKYQITNNKSFVHLTIYDVAGREVIKLVNKVQNAGTYKVDWNAAGYSSGIYFYSLTVNRKIVETKKMVLIK